MPWLAPPPTLPVRRKRPVEHQGTAGQAMVANSPGAPRGPAPWGRPHHTRRLEEAKARHAHMGVEAATPM